jgi:hypothetical protein
MSNHALPRVLPAVGAALLALGTAASCGPGPAATPSLPASGSQGSHIDNGGDVITCAQDDDLASSGRPYFTPGTYTLDYVLAYDPRVGTTEDPQGAWPSQQRRIQDLVRTKVPELEDGLTEYLQALESGSESGVRVWKASSLPLADIADEDIVQQVPDNCKVVRDGKLVPNLQQMVRRRYLIDADVPKVFYLYDHQRMAQLKATLPLQYAYLVTHEWLWDYADGAWANRSVNRILQSTATAAMTATEVRQAVRSYGITGDEGGFLGQPSPRLAEMRAEYEANPLCQFERRASAEFLADNGRDALVPGETRLFELHVPDLKPTVGSKACGFSLLFSHRALSGSGGIDVALERGPASIPFSLSSSTGALRQELLTGMCRGGLCIEQDGPLKKLLTYQSFGQSRWRLRVTNRATSTGKVEVVLPYFVFVKMRD